MNKNLNKSEFFTFREVQHCAEILDQWIDIEFVIKAFWDIAFKPITADDMMHIRQATQTLTLRGG